MLATGLLAILLTSVTISAQQPQEKMVTVAAIEPAPQAAPPATRFPVSPEVATARESARIQFERDIGVADAELATAQRAVLAEHAVLKQMHERALRGEGTLAEAQEEGIAVKAVMDDYVAKKTRCLFLRSEALRLNIPVSAMPPPPPPLPSLRPTR